MRKFKNFLFVLITSLLLGRVIFLGFTSDEDEIAYLSEFDGAVDIELNVTGYVKHLRISEGEKVQKNQVLMELDIPDLISQIKQAKTQYEEARNKYRQQLELYKQNQDKSGLETAANSLKRSEKRFYDLQNYMSQNTLAAPMSGKILKLRVKEGELVQAGRIIIEIKP